MAGELKGKIFEIITSLAFEDLGYKNNFDFFWEKKPVGFSMNPDFIIGSLDNPTHWFLVTTTISAKNSNMKLWRNLGELFEVKRKYIPAPKVIDLVLENQQDISVKNAMTRISDGELCIESKPYGNTIIKFIEKHIELIPKNDEDRINYLRLEINKNKNVKIATKQYTKALKKVLNEKNMELDSLWLLLNKKKSVSAICSAKSTYLKRGVAKLMITSTDERILIYENIKKKKKLKPLPAFFYKLNFAQKTLAGSEIIDSEIISVVLQYDKDIIEFIINRSYVDRQEHWDKWINTLRNNQILKYHSYLLKNRAELITPLGMLEHLLNHTSDGLRWLFWHMIEVFKADSNRKQGYGFAVLAKDVGYTRGISQGYKYLADWANGALKTPLPDSLITDVARAFSKRLLDISERRLIQLGNTIEHETLHNLLEQKLVSYVMFEPIPILLDKLFKKHGIKYERIQRFPSFISEMLNNRNRITTPIIKVGPNIIHWKSAYDKGRHHKTKELSGRAPALSYQYKDKKFSKRNEIDNLYLILDGTFTQKQVDTLLASGWDKIFYSTQLDELIKIII